MRVLFCTSKLPGAVLIRAVTWSQWSHVALAHVIVDLPCDFREFVIEAARSQVGKPYDPTALFGLLMHRDWQEEDRWFCSELVAWAFAQGGSPLFRAEALHRVTPQLLWMLAPEPPPPDLVFLPSIQGRPERPFS